jgi:hypothetical protein
VDGLEERVIEALDHDHEILFGKGRAGTESQRSGGRQKYDPLHQYPPFASPIAATYQISGGGCRALSVMTFAETFPSRRHLLKWQRTTPHALPKPRRRT